MMRATLRNILFAILFHALGSKHFFSVAWQPSYPNNQRFSLPTKSGIGPLSSKDSDSDESTVEEYRNVATQVLSKFMQKDKMEMEPIDFEAPKISPSTSLSALAEALDYELTEKEWFVTGNVNPSYFSKDFRFQDPDVKVDSIEDYSKGVRKIFDQETARAEILSTLVNEESSTPERPVITIKWRLSGGVNIGFGLTIKPYIVYTDFVIDPETSLVIFQEDRFDSPSWDILLRWVSLEWLAIIACAVMHNSESICCLQTSVFLI